MTVSIPIRKETRIAILNLNLTNKIQDTPVLFLNGAVYAGFSSRCYIEYIHHQ